MKANIIRIGNSKGIRLPKPLIDWVGLVEEVELEMPGVNGRVYLLAVVTLLILFAVGMAMRIASIR